MLDRQHLTILREVDRLGSLTAAAERLNLTQSALSHAIAKFEARQGVKLWRREGRGLRLTQAGTHLLELAGRVLPQFEHAEQMLAELARGTRGALRAGMECHPCQQWLMRVVAPYLATWPDVDLDLRTAFRFDGIAALLGHEIDLLITPDPVDLAGVTYTRVFTYRMVLAVPEAYPLRRPVRPQDLRDEVLLSYPVARERLDVFTRFLIPAGCRPRRHRRVETTEMMLQLVASGRGVSAVPDWILREEGAGLPIRALPLGAGLEKGLHIGLRAGEEEVDYLAGFIALAREAGQRMTTG